MPRFTNRGIDANKALGYDRRRWAGTVNLDLLANEYAAYVEILPIVACTVYATTQSYGNVSFNTDKILFLNRTGINKTMTDASGFGIFAWTRYPSDNICLSGFPGNLQQISFNIGLSASLSILGGSITNDTVTSASARVFGNSPASVLGSGSTQTRPNNLLTSATYPTLTQTGVGQVTYWRGPINVQCPATRIIEFV